MVEEEKINFVLRPFAMRDILSYRSAMQHGPSTSNANPSSQDQNQHPPLPSRLANAVCCASRAEDSASSGSDGAEREDDGCQARNKTAAERGDVDMADLAETTDIEDGQATLEDIANIVDLGPLMECMDASRMWLFH